MKMATNTPNLSRKSTDGMRRVMITEAEGMVILSSMVDGFRYRSWPVNDDLLEMIEATITEYFLKKRQSRPTKLNSMRST